MQLSAGVRDDESLAWALSTGAARVVVSSSALVDRAWCARVLDEHTDRVVVALDVRMDMSPAGARQRVISPRGSAGDVGELFDVLRFLDRCGCRRSVVTDVSRDGALSGPNLELYRAVRDATRARVIASGGVSSLDDLRALASLAREKDNLEDALAVLDAGG